MEAKPTQPANGGIMEMDNICYSNNFLSSVIFRLNYDVYPILSFDDQVIGGLLEIYPIYEKVIEKVVAVNLKSSKTPNIQKDAESHIFYTAKKDYKLTFSVIQKAIIIEALIYSTWSDFKTTILNSIDKIDCIKDKRTNRIGLRYVNNIPLKEYSFVKTYFKDSISGPFSNSLGDKSLSRFVIVKENYYESFMARFQYGIPNQYHPNPIIVSVFLIDIDSFSLLESEFNQIPDYLDSFHTYIQTTFEASITESLRKLLRKKING